MIRNCLTIIMLCLLAACNVGGAGASSIVRPLDPPFMPGPPENAPQEYRQGWLDGCETGFAMHGSDIYRTTYHFRQDPSQVLNPIYYRAWNDAQNFCLTYIFEYSYRATTTWCSLDGITDDCSDNTGYNSLPFAGASTESLGYAVFGKPGADSFIPTKGDIFMGGPEDGIDGVMGEGWAGTPKMAGAW